MTELEAARGKTHFVMSVGDHPILKLTGTLRVEELGVDPGEIQFWIERREGKGGGFQITERGWGRADWLPAETATRALEIRMKQGHPVFSLRVEEGATA